MKRIYKHGMVFLVFTLLLLTMIIGYISTSSESIISINGDSIDSVNMQGVKCSVDDNLIKLKTEHDIELIENSRDPITGNLTYRLPVTVLSIDNKTEPVIADSFISSIKINEATEYELEFPYIIKDGRKQIVSYEADYSLIKIPNMNKYVVEKGGVMFLLDPETESMQFYCLPEVMGYSQYRNTRIINGIEHAQVWAIRASFNEDGTRMIYYTERATEEIGNVWAKDTVTGEEKPVPNTPVYTKVLQWRENRYAYLLSFGKIIEIDTVELSSKTIYDAEDQGRNTLGFIYPYVFVPTSNSETQIINLTNSKINVFNDKDYLRCIDICSVPNTYLVLLRYSCPNSINMGHDEAVVLDLSTGEKCVISIPDEYSISVFAPYRDYIRLNICKTGAVYNQMTYFIPFTDIDFVD